MSFQAPIGSPEEIAAGDIWPGRWTDATPYLTQYSLGYHTGADLNLNYPYWDADMHSAVFAVGPGKVVYAQLYSTKVWGNIIVIDHGIVDGLPLVTRYGHIENILVTVGQQVQKGEHIANVGNGEGLFPYHLHFDVSTTDALLTKAWHWPGSDLALTKANYVDPKEWLQAHRQADAVADGVIHQAPPPPNTQDVYISASVGLKVRQDHSTTSTSITVLTRGTRVTINRQERVNQESYTWGHLVGGTNSGNWIALGKADQSEAYVSNNPVT
jgi:murein DD-endopeptidase MepM/ murein hydrolase activator NlpD